MNRIRLLILALVPMTGCASFQSTLTMTATTADGNSVTISATDGVLANNISKLVGDAQFQKGADGSSNTIVNLGSDRNVNTDNQASSLGKAIETTGTIAGAAIGAMAGSGAGGVGAVPGAAVGGVAGNAVGSAISGALGQAGAPAPVHDHATQDHAPAHQTHPATDHHAVDHSHNPEVDTHHIPGL